MKKESKVSVDMCLEKLKAIYRGKDGREFLSLEVIGINELANALVRYRGKYRKVALIGEGRKNQLIKKFVIEEKNLQYLRFPYLTVEQSAGHMRSLKAETAQPKKPIFLKVFKEDVTLSEKLGHLLYKDVWE